MRPIFQWRLNSRVLELGRRTLIMGIVNVTPDSFSDGGVFIDAEKAVAHSEKLLDEGAGIIDVGGESTRPGTAIASPAAYTHRRLPPGTQAAAAAAKPAPPALSEEEEKARILPVIRELKRRRPDAIVSVDTYKSSVARAAIEAGAEVVNDVSGGLWDQKMAKVLAEFQVGVILMHTRGRPEEWASLPPIGDSVLTVKRDLQQIAQTATLAGIKRDRIVLDPGFGFGKRYEENHPLLAHFAQLQHMGFPLLAGVSRKGFIGRLLLRSEVGYSEKTDPKKDAEVSDRLFGTLAGETALILKGAHIIRTHDVRATADAARVADAVVASGG